MLTVVISLANQTLRQSKDLSDFSERFMGRVNALAAAYTLLSRDSWTDVALRDVLTEELRPFMAVTRDGVVMDGDPLFLTPRGALALGMIVHELVTNAVKYGSLSLPGGRVGIHWEIVSGDDAARLIWRWTERDGPPVLPPKRRGFGMAMIERSVRHELKGEAQIAFEPGGVQVTLTMPLAPAVARCGPPGESTHG
jgi:two-component system CheB/CheR fusion protein